jgi:4-hydroxy-3-polyprenylbenzoate decarboxylase
MDFRALGEFSRYLESIGELKRITIQVDPELEITEIATSALKRGLPALLFENVKGSSFPLAINLFASERRIELALGKHPDQLGEELITFAEQAMPPAAGFVHSNRGIVRRLFASRPKEIDAALSQEHVGEPRLDRLPIIRCWPEDGGKFITLPQVFTYDPRNGRRNVGMYRMQVFDRRTTGMHWQIQKGGGFHYYHADKLNRSVEIAVALGTDPALLMATIAALPEGIDEAMFAGFLRKKRTEFVRGRSISVPVPANAEFILEGIVHAKERRLEGPFGDHFGHYSAASEFPVFHVTAMTHRTNPIFPATVVGIPPMEDKFLGDATQRILGPLAKLLHSEIRGLWAYYEAGFHNLLVVAIEERYQKEAMKTALGLMGTGQLSLTKCIVMVSEDVNPRNFSEVLSALHRNFDPHFDFVMIPKVPLDTLDFTSYKMNLGSKMILDATRKSGKEPREVKRGRLDVARIKELDRRILDAAIVGDGFVLVKVKDEGKLVLQELAPRPEFQDVTILAAVSEDIDLKNQESYLWGVFTRFDCERDVIFAEQSLYGISPVYKGVLGIDATWKQGYPETLVMNEDIRELVRRRWDKYWN